jgi:hypothetical protein
MKQYYDKIASPLVYLVVAIVFCASIFIFIAGLFSIFKTGPRFENFKAGDSVYITWESGRSTQTFVSTVYINERTLFLTSKSGNVIISASRD